MISERVTAEPVFNCLISNWLYSTALTQHLFPSKVEDTCIVKQSNYLLFISTSTLLVARVGVGRHMPVPKGATDDLETTDRPPDSYLSRSFNTKPDYTVIGRALIYSTTSPQRWNFSSPDCLTMKNLTPPSFFFFLTLMQCLVLVSLSTTSCSQTHKLCQWSRGHEQTWVFTGR